LKALRGKRVRVFGWVHLLRDHKGVIFVTVRDGTGYLQCVLSGPMVCPFLSWETVTNGFQVQTLTLTRESSVELVGTLQELPHGKTARGGHELSVDYWQVISMAPGGDDVFTNRVNEVPSFLF